MGEDMVYIGECFQLVKNVYSAVVGKVINGYLLYAGNGVGINCVLTDFLTTVDIVVLQSSTTIVDSCIFLAVLSIFALLILILSFRLMHIKHH